MGPVLADRRWSFDPAGAAIGVNVFESIDLPAHWHVWTPFEGPGYQRVVTTVHMPTGDVDAYIYVLLQCRTEYLVQRGSVDRPAVFAVPAARRHAFPRLVACICRDAGAFCRELNRLVVGRSRIGWMHRSPYEWTVRTDR